MSLAKALLLVSASLSISFAAQAATNIVQDPGFEGATLSPWTSNGFNLLSGVAHSGSQYVSDTSCAFGCSDSISQILSTAPGSTYTLSFFAYTTDANTATPVVSVDWNGLAVFSQVIPTVITPQWLQYTVSGLTANSASTSLQFGIVPAAHLQLDDVSVTASPVAAVPEPDTWVLLAAGLSATGVAVRRRRSKVGQ